MMPNVHGLPQNLRKDNGGYFLDYRVQEGGRIKRVRHRLGQIPLAHAKRIYAKHLQEMAEHKFLTIEKPKVTFNEAADSFLAYSRARKKSFKNDAQIVARLKAYFGEKPLESLSPDLVEIFLTQRRQEGNTQLPGKPLSGSTLNHDIATLKSIVRRAVLNRQIERNPIEGVVLSSGSPVRIRTGAPYFSTVLRLHLLPGPAPCHIRVKLPLNL
jgi:hypothetical protein